MSASGADASLASPDFQAGSISGAGGVSDPGAPAWASAPQTVGPAGDGARPSGGGGVNRLPGTLTYGTVSPGTPGRTCEAEGTCASQDQTKECFKWGKLYPDGQYRGYCAAYNCVVMDTARILGGSLNPAANRVHTQLKRLMLKVREDAQRALDLELAALEAVDGAGLGACPPCDGACGILSLCATRVRGQLADIVNKLNEEKTLLTSGISCLDGYGFPGGNQNLPSGRDVRCPEIRDPRIRPPPGCRVPRMPQDLGSCHQSALDALRAEDEAIRLINDLVLSIDSNRAGCTDPSQGKETVTRDPPCGCTDDGAGNCIPNTCPIDCPAGEGMISRFDGAIDPVLAKQQRVHDDPFRDPWARRHPDEISPVTGGIMAEIEDSRDLVKDQLEAMEVVMDHRMWPAGGETNVRDTLETLNTKAIPQLRSPEDRRTRNFVDGSWDLNRAGLLLKSSGSKWYDWALPFCKPGEIGPNPFN